MFPAAIQTAEVEVPCTNLTAALDFFTTRADFRVDLIFSGGCAADGGDPGRLSGRFVASRIGIPDGGEVPDYVHFHRVRFRIVLCEVASVSIAALRPWSSAQIQSLDCCQATVKSVHLAHSLASHKTARRAAWPSVRNAKTRMRLPRPHSA